MRNGGQRADPPGGADSVWVSTFHSALRPESSDVSLKNLGYESRSFSIYDTDDQKTLMKQIFKEREIKWKAV